MAHASSFTSCSRCTQRAKMLKVSYLCCISLIVLLCNVILTNVSLHVNGQVHDAANEHNRYSLDDGARYKRETPIPPSDSSEAALKKQVTKKPTNMDKDKIGGKPPLPAKSASLSVSGASPSTAGVESSSPMTTAMVSSVEAGDVAGDKNHYDSNAGGSVTDADGPLPDDENIPSPPQGEIEHEDNHTYYRSDFLTGPKAELFWVDLDQLKEQGGSLVKRHEMLSNSHRRAATVTLGFEFPYYGYPLKNITIATGGFLYLGDHVHSWLAATQYIAPLMANFDTSLSNDSHVIYADNGTAFIVEWRGVHIQDKLELGNFTFQVTLKSNGEIYFAYKSIPIPVADIPELKHPVKVGIADAYVVDRTVFFIRRRTLYEYHRANLKDYPIRNDTAIVFTPLPTCISMKSCGECMKTNETNQGLECRWCESVKRCSDGMDRYRQTWINKGCDRQSIKTIDTCPAGSSTEATTSAGGSTAASSSLPSSVPTSSPNIPSDARARAGSRSAIEPGTSSRDQSGGAGLLSVLVIMALMSGVAVWILYAYRNPQTSSGQFLIKYRPSRWRFNGSEARYSAASIHM